MHNALSFWGGGSQDITAAFVTKYLMDLLPHNCSKSSSSSSFQSVTLLDPIFYVDDSDRASASTQSRDLPRAFGGGDEELSTKLHPLISEMVQKGNLTTFQSSTNSNRSIAFYNGNEAAFQTTWETLYRDIYWRYSMDYYVVLRLASKVQAKLDQAYRILQDHDSILESPMDLWKQAGLGGLAKTPMNVLLERYFVKEHLPVWRQLLQLLPWIPQGLLRTELLSSILQRHYHQDVSQINSLAGLMAFLLAMEDHGNQYFVDGSVEQLAQSAWEQAKQTYISKCGSNVANTISHEPLKVATVVGSVAGFDLYDEKGQLIGVYDQVVLAQPLSNNDVEFLIKSHVDETAVLQQMPLGGLIENSDESVMSMDHEGHDVLPRQLDPIATRPYIRIVTTYVEGATLQRDYWFSTTTKATVSNDIPQQILMTSKGKMIESNVTEIINVGDGKYKVTSSQALTKDVLQRIFGSDVKVAQTSSHDISPDFRGEYVSTNFLLYDGATGFQGHTNAGALYHPRAMELTIGNNIEMQAIGAKAVAKLLAQRLEWTESTISSYSGDEL
jgi:Prenylcysteine lyase